MLAETASNAAATVGLLMECSQVLQAMELLSHDLLRIEEVTFTSTTSQAGHTLSAHAGPQLDV